MIKHRIIDFNDTKILDILQENARVANAALARAVKLAPSAVLARVRRLERDGVIRGYATVLDRRSVGRNVLAFVTVRTREPPRRMAVARALTKLPEVLEVHDVAGEDCYLIKVAARDIADLHQLVHYRVGAVPDVRGTTTIIVMETFKESTSVPLNAVKKTPLRKKRNS